MKKKDIKPTNKKTKNRRAKQKAKSTSRKLTVCFLIALLLLTIIPVFM